MAPVVALAVTSYPMCFKVLNSVSDVLTGDLPRSSKAATAVVANDQLVRGFASTDAGVVWPSPASTEPVNSA